MFGVIFMISWKSFQRLLLHHESSYMYTLCLSVHIILNKNTRLTYLWDLNKRNMKSWRLIITKEFLVFFFYLRKNMNEIFQFKNCLQIDNESRSNFGDSSRKNFSIYFQINDLQLTNVWEGLKTYCLGLQSDVALMRIIKKKAHF